MDKNHLYNARTMLDENEIQPDTLVDDIEESVVDDTELEEVEERLEDTVKALRSKLSECLNAKAELHEDLQRTKADFLNSRRRLEEQSVRSIERATNDLLLDVLPLIDSFDTALGDTESVKRLDPVWQKGIEGIRALLTAFLKRHGVTEIETVGTHFNPHEHDAVTNIQVEDNTQVDTVIGVLQKGYKRNETVLRPAKVTVGIHNH